MTLIEHGKRRGSSDNKVRREPGLKTFAIRVEKRPERAPTADWKQQEAGEGQHESGACELIPNLQPL